MVGDHHGEDDDDGDEDEDGEDDGSKVADDSGLAPSVHCSRWLHVRSFKHSPFHISKGKSSMAISMELAGRHLWSEQTRLQSGEGSLKTC